MKRLLLTALAFCSAIACNSQVRFVNTTGRTIDLAQQSSTIKGNEVLVYTNSAKVPANAVHVGKLSGRMGPANAKVYAARGGGNILLLITKPLSEEEMPLFYSGAGRTGVEYEVYHTADTSHH